MGPTRVLLLEDHADTLNTLSSLLRDSGFYVCTAATVREALELCGGQSFDLLIADIGLPDGDGWTFMTDLLKSTDIKGIAISGFGMPEDIERSLKAGFAVHLIKPVSFQKIESTIREVMAR